MFIYLFGLPAAGKDYVAEVLADEFGFQAHDGDEDLTDELREAVRERRPFTDKMRDRYYDVLVNSISELRINDAELAFAQATFKERHREQIAGAFPDVVFVLVEADEDVRMARLQGGGLDVSADYARRIESFFEQPTHPHFVITNNGRREEVVEQLRDLLTTLDQTEQPAGQDLPQRRQES